MLDSRVNEEVMLLTNGKIPLCLFSWDLIVNGVLDLP